MPLPLVLATWKRDLQARRRATFAILTAFLACYVWFVFYPVAGPYYEFARPDGAFVANPAARLVYGVLGQASSYGAAFPSSHVAGTWAAVASVSIAAWRWPLALIACALTVGVVYCQMHYAIDAIAGLLVAAGAMLAARAFARAHPR
ncbi:MAG: phosphatase PAP2 family protein [Gemmatimonadales bacterium]